jgi:hypothetical protein
MEIPMTVDRQMFITDDMLSAAIKAMPGDHFDFHQIILKVAEKNQPDYVKALYAEVEGGREDHPFRALHIGLGPRIRRLCAEKYTYSEHSSPDIFGNKDKCAYYSRIKPKGSKD